MTLDPIRSAMHAQPFRPFTIDLVDGRTFLVRHPDFIAVSPNGRAMTVYDDDGGQHLLDLVLVSELYVPPAPAPSESS